MVRRRYRPGTWNESSEPDSVALVQSIFSHIQIILMVMVIGIVAVQSIFSSIQPAWCHAFLSWCDLGQWPRNHLVALESDTTTPSLGQVHLCHNSYPLFTFPLCFVIQVWKIGSSSSFGFLTDVQGLTPPKKHWKRIYSQTLRSLCRDNKQTIGHSKWWIRQKLLSQSLCALFWSLWPQSLLV